MQALTKVRWPPFNGVGRNGAGEEGLAEFTQLKIINMAL